MIEANDDGYASRPVDKKLKIGNWSMRLPKNRAARMALGFGLVAGGTLGFLPILGFWMIPVGLLVLSHDIAAVRRMRRRTVLWWERRRARRQGR